MLPFKQLTICYKLTFISIFRIDQGLDWESASQSVNWLGCYFCIYLPLVSRQVE